MVLTAPFPYFGGKSRIARDIWARLGNVPNFVEPFFGSGAVLLARPHPPGVETVSDADHFVSNFWRAVQSDPDAVAHYADWPVNETDLEATHYWLVTKGAARIAGIEGDPMAYDAQVAGWWLWGICIWIGHGFCTGKGSWWWDGKAWRDDATGVGINRQLPHLSDAGTGISRALPHLGNPGKGINRQLTPGVARTEYIRSLMLALADRLRDVRVCAGDWSRVCTPALTCKRWLTGVFLDPPYSADADRCADVYATDSDTVAVEVRKWAITQGANPLMRIAFCGYEDEYEFPPDWEVLRWKGYGGYGNQGNGRGRANAARETVWFSPHCLNTDTLFKDAEPGDDPGKGE